MVRLNNLYKWMVFVGLKVHVVKNWSTRGSSSFAPTIQLVHWTAGPRGAKPGTRPSLNVVVNGRPGLPGPLCQDYLGRDGAVTLVASGRANHAGYGYWKGVTGNTGADGTEAEAADNSDWTDAQRRAYPLVQVAKLFAKWEKGQIAWDQIASNRVAGHSEYALPKGRKIDVNGYTMTQLRAQIAALIPGFKKRVNGKPIAVGTAPVFDIDTYQFIDGTKAPTPTTQRKSWFDMATEDTLRKVVREELPNARITVTRSGKKVTRSLETLIGNLDANVATKELIADEIMDVRIPVMRSGEKVTRRLATLISGQDSAHNRLAGEMEALKEVVHQMANGQGVEIDYNKVEEAAARGTARAIEEADLAGE